MILSSKNYKQHGLLKGILYYIKYLVLNTISKLGRRKNKYVQLPSSFLIKNHRGYPVLKLLEEDEKLKCVGCGLCEKVCPTECISLEGNHKNSSLTVGEAPKSFNIELLKCTRCNLCSEVCPVEAIELSGSYDFYSDVDKDVWTIDKLTQKN